MTLNADQQRIKTLLTETITLLCKNGLPFKSEFCVEGLLGITLDKHEVFLVNINETIHGTGREKPTPALVEQTPVSEVTLNRSASNTMKALAQRYQLSENNAGNDAAVSMATSRCGFDATASAPPLPSTQPQTSFTLGNAAGNEPLILGVSSAPSEENRWSVGSFESSEDMSESPSTDNSDLQKYSSEQMAELARKSDANDWELVCHKSSESMNNQSSSQHRTSADVIEIKEELDDDDVDVLSALRSERNCPLSLQSDYSQARFPQMSPRLNNFSSPALSMIPGCSWSSGQQNDRFPGVPEVELVHGSGVYVSTRALECLASETRGTRLVRSLLHELFPDEHVLAASSCRGRHFSNNTVKDALDRNKIEAIREFVSWRCPSLSSAEFVQCVNVACGDARKNIKRRLRRRQRSLPYSIPSAFFT